MSLTAGIVGLPNVGKSTLFNAITKKNILAANYPFATIDPNVGMVTVPDERLDELVKIAEPDKTIPTTFEFTDIAGLVKGASKGEGLGNKFLSHIREVDAIVQVVRCFDDPNIIHVENKIDPISDIETINLELIIADLDIITNRIDKIKKKAQTSKDRDALEELEALEIAKDTLERNVTLRLSALTKEQEEILRPFNFLTLKPVIYLANVNEEELAKEDNDYVQKVKSLALTEGAKCIRICAKVEAELTELSDIEKKEMLEMIGISESGLDVLIKETYDLLGLATYFTVGKQEVRAWTFKKGMTAPQCAGVIHSDFERGFIRAEVIKYEDMIAYRSELKVKEAGKFRVEGKEYIMQDGDICHFRFNV